MDTDGALDIDRAGSALAARLPEALQPLARLAYNYSWSWTEDGRALLHDLDPHRWELTSGNMVSFLEQLTPTALARIADDPGLVARIDALAAEVDRSLAPSVAGPSPRVAFFCAEFAIHASLPIYAGGLGVLAGDMLKEASDRGLPHVGVGLLYRRGYFHQRLDLRGWQRESWEVMDPDHSPPVRVTSDGVAPLLVSVPVFGREVVCQIWRVDVGRVPLYLLDSERPENRAVDRWITSRLYEGNRAIRLAQYAVLGIGGIRALEALGVEHDVVHLNEGHPALAALELVAQRVATGSTFDDAVPEVRSGFVFTTHTPVPAGNETYGPDEFLAAFGDLPARLGIDDDRFLGLCRIHPDDLVEAPGLTPLALRLSRHVNGVSRRHGEVARAMWQPLFGRADVDDVPIGHVTNGVHLPTFMAPPVRRLFDAHLGPGWASHASDPAVWRDLDAIPAAELWRLRCDLRAGTIERVRRQSVQDRLLRGEQIDYVEAAAETLSDDALTIGFARRIATYKRLHLLTHDVNRALALLDPPRPVQLLFAGKAHPNDERAKQIVQTLFEVKRDPRVGRRVAFLEDYDLSTATWLVAGCDVWVNLPRPPNEASGTSGMKVVLNGGLNLSVLDGWWAEAYDGTNGWAIDGAVDHDETAQDARHAEALYHLIESEVVPLFYERDADGVPVGWVELVRASLRTLAPQFVATRMVEDYVRTVYPADRS
ncbi:MAG: alpha-glucan family phosphorylase [Acidimicrobiales bacterium]